MASNKKGLTSGKTRMTSSAKVNDGPGLVDVVVSDKAESQVVYDIQATSVKSVFSAEDKSQSAIYIVSPKADEDNGNFAWARASSDDKTSTHKDFMSRKVGTTSADVIDWA